MPLYTGSGDAGETHLADNTRVAKDDDRVAAYGNLDELSAVLGLCRAGDSTGAIGERIDRLQAELFTLGAELARPDPGKNIGGPTVISSPHVRRLERWIDEACEIAGPLTTFILPGGTELACRLHQARAVCRRAERSVITLHRSEPLRGGMIVYLNRLSDLLFAWARLANRQAGVPDVAWKPTRES